MPMKQENFSLTPEQEQELQSLAEMPDEEIDFSDIPKNAGLVRRSAWHVLPGQPVAQRTP